MGYVGNREQVVSSVHMSAVGRGKKHGAKREGVVTWKRERGDGAQCTQCLQKGRWQVGKQAQASKGSGSAFTAECDPRHLELPLAE